MSQLAVSLYCISSNINLPLTTVSLSLVWKKGLVEANKPLNVCARQHTSLVMKQSTDWLPFNQVPILGQSNCLWNLGCPWFYPFYIGMDGQDMIKEGSSGLQRSAWSSESSKLLLKSNEEIKEIISLIEIKVDFCFSFISLTFPTVTQ